jgi:23S rRNA pseudoU1915 N3-methylase RlmH
MVTVGGMMLLNLIFTFREIYQPLKLKVYTWWYLKKLRKVREREEIELKAKKERREERKIKKIKKQEEQQIKHIEEEKAIIDRLF